MKKAYLISSFTIALVLASFPALMDSASASKSEVFDGTGDVIKYSTVNVGVQGYQELDLISLTTNERGLNVEAVMGVEGEISDEPGYLYTMSVGGVNIAYESGEVEVWKWTGQSDPLDDVLVTVSGSTVNALIPLIHIDRSDFRVNGTAFQYVLEYQGEGIEETYHDSIGDFGGNGSRSVLDLEVQYQDQNGDVMLTYRDARPVEIDYLDIVKLEVERLSDGDVKVMLLTADSISSDDMVTYLVMVGRVEINVTGGVGTILYGSSESDEPAVIENNKISAVLDGSRIDDDLGTIRARSSRISTEDEYWEDNAPDDPSYLTELLPFQKGNSEELVIEVKGPENVLVTRSFSGFESELSISIRTSIDSDDDGYIYEREVRDHFSGFGDWVEMSYWSMVTVDGVEGDLEASLSYEGFLGEVNGREGISISWTFNYTFDPADRSSHTIASRGPQSNILEEVRGSFKAHILISVDGDWSMDPLTLKPEELSNSISPDSTRVDHTEEGAAGDDLFSEDITFDIEKDKDGPGNGISDGEGQGDEDEIGVWVYVLVLAGMGGLVLGLYIWTRREE